MESIRPLLCGNVTRFCPAGSSLPQSVLPGYYSAGGVNASTQVAQSECPGGSYCLAGVIVPCPAGRWRSSFGAVDLSGCNDCPAGSFCGISTTSPFLCGDDSVSTGKCDGDSPVSLPTCEFPQSIRWAAVFDHLATVVCFLHSCTVRRDRLVPSKWATATTRWVPSALALIVPCVPSDRTALVVL